jgi:hypothetical protein
MTVPSTSIASSFGNENLSSDDSRGCHYEARPDNTNHRTAQVANAARG